jgi:putative two-component system response regulator
MEEKKKILIVDDIPQNIALLNEILKDNYVISAATKGAKAIEIAQSEAPPDLILLDIQMPGMDGYTVCKKFKNNETTRDIPIIFVTTKSEVEDETTGLELGAVDYLIKPVNPSIVKARIKNHLELKEAREYLKNQNIILEEKVVERTKELIITQDVTIQCMASLAETRDNETGGHIRRTQNYVRALAEKLSEKKKYRNIFDFRTIDLLQKSAPLHDIGKVGIPDSILLKPGKLTEEEFEVMKKHTTLGRDAIATAEIQLGTTSFLASAKEIAYSHHEKWDGGGYPEGVSGEAIPLSGRLMALADVYDALISKRVYNPPFPHSKAVSIIKEESGSHFDPDLVEAFSSISEEFRQIALEFVDGEDEREALSQ